MKTIDNLGSQLLNGNVSWVGFANKVSCDVKNRSNFRKVLEIPFKMNGLDNKYMLQIIHLKKDGKSVFFESFFEILEEHDGVIHAVLLDDNVLKNPIFLHIVNQKNIRFKLTWIYGYSHLFKKIK